MDNVSEHKKKIAEAEALLMCDNSPKREHDLKVYHRRLKKELRQFISYTKG